MSGTAMAVAPPPPPTNNSDIDLDQLSRDVLCFSETIYRANGVWEGPDPLTPIIPLFLLQIMVAIFFSRLLNYALKQLHQPPVVAEIISGIILGPSALGGIKAFQSLLFPNNNFVIIETMAHLALVLYAFMIGLQTEAQAVLRTGSKAKAVAFFGTFVPFLIGISVYFALPHDVKAGFVLCGGALVVTGFSTLAKILDNQRVLQTEVAKIALSSAYINDLASWVFLAIGLIATGSSTDLWAIICNLGYLVFAVYYLRPLLSWTIRKTSEGQGYSELYICSLLIGTMISGIITDALGTHPMIGAFIFGLIVPCPILEAAILDKLEEFVMGVLMPVFFVVCGLRTNIDIITTDTNLIVVILAIIFAFSAKIIGALCSTCACGISASDAIAIGVLTNTKSTMAMVLLEMGQVHQVLNTQVYSVMVISVLVMTIVVTPLTTMYRPTEDLMPYKRKTIEKAKPNEELRVLACIYNTNDTGPIIHLLESSNSTQKSPISVFGLQMVELVGRAAPAMVVVHNSSRRGTSRNLSHEEVQTSQIINAFDNYELRSQGVSTQILTARSTFSTMAEDICNIAKEKRAAFVVLPFHKQAVDGDMEETNPAIQSVNESVLINAPCSVGILIDRRNSFSTDRARNIIMLYFGGPDDREALSLGWRMAEQDGVHLTVIRFIPGKEMSDPDTFGLSNYNKSFVSIAIDTYKDKEFDNEFIKNFKSQTLENKAITYVELILNDEEEAINAIKAMDGRNYDLYIVGRGRGVVSPLTAGLADWCDCPELGPIGDLLVTSEFESAFSVLVIQQYMKSSRSPEESVKSSGKMSQIIDDDNPLHTYSSASNKVEEIALRRSMSETESAFESFPSFNGRDHV